MCAVFSVRFTTLHRNSQKKEVCAWVEKLCVCVACSSNVDKSSSYTCRNTFFFHGWPHSSHKLDVQKWFYFSIRCWLILPLDAVGDDNPVIFTVDLKKTFAWKCINFNDRVVDVLREHYEQVCWKKVNELGTKTSTMPFPCKNEAESLQRLMENLENQFNLFYGTFVCF